MYNKLTLTSITISTDYSEKDFFFFNKAQRKLYILVRKKGTSLKSSETLLLLL